MTLHQAFEWLEMTSVGVMVRESLYGFPIVVAIHIMGIMLSVGMLVWFDLRLLGVSMLANRASLMYRRLMPWMFTGFAMMFISGGMLLAGYATSAYSNLYFRIKVVAMLLAALNAFAYHFMTERRIAQWDADATPPTRRPLRGPDLDLRVGDGHHRRADDVLYDVLSGLRPRHNLPDHAKGIWSSSLRCWQARSRFARNRPSLVSGRASTRRPRPSEARRRSW